VKQRGRRASGIFGSPCRRSAQIFQEELADRAGIHRTYVSQIERGLKSPTIVMLLKLSKALETSPSTIIRQFEAGIGSRK
jgi:transcriptional regulator with XRE-family HTH domain